jgi:hypothetical protein
MGKNTKGGKNAKRGKNGGGKPVRQIVLRSPGENYAQVLRNLGNGIIEIKVFKDDGSTVEAQAKVRGSVRRCKFVRDDIVLACQRDFGKCVYDVFVKYTLDHVQELIYSGQIPGLDMGSITFAKESDNDIYDEDEIEADNSKSDKENEDNSSENDNNSEDDNSSEDDIFYSDQVGKVSKTKNKDKDKAKLRFDSEYAESDAESDTGPDAKSDTGSDAESKSDYESDSESKEKMDQSVEVKRTKKELKHLEKIMSKGKSAKSTKAEYQSQRSKKLYQNCDINISEINI